MKRLTLPYFLLPLVIVAGALCLSCQVDDGGLLMSNAYVLYLFRLVAVLLSLASMVSAFTLLKEKPLWQMLTLNLSALLVILDYYLNVSNPGSDNLLWLLPMIVVVYVARYKAISNKTNSSEIAE